jgi:homoserine dehydrogenase
MNQRGTINVGIVGLGTVGGGTLELLQSNQGLIAERTGLDLQVTHIADVNPALRTRPDLRGINLVTDFRELIAHPAVSIVVETVGGTGDPAYAVIEGALRAGKFVVTANKALLAERGAPLFQLAQDHGTGLFFEAAVCGGIPIIRSLQESLVGNNITKIIGILNGTSNYILTKMRTDKKTFAQALKDAQKAGFAEADPTLDISGMDTAHKLSLLCTLAWGVPVDPQKIPRVGIAKVDGEDIWFAQEIGYRIRLLALARREGNTLCIQVHPTMVPAESMMGAVEAEFNAVALLADHADSIFFSGKGAGARPTGSSVVSDIVAAARFIQAGTRMKPFLVYRPEESREITLTKTIIAAYYLRMKVIDRPGVLGKITTILGDNQVSISRVVQHSNTPTGEAVIVIITHQCANQSVKQAAETLNSLEILKEKVIIIQIEEDV